MFRDRFDAGTALSRALFPKYGASNPLVLGIPRGGIPLAKVIAQHLHGDLDVVLVRKLRHPYYPEVGIGAIGETGTMVLEPGYELKGYVEQEVSKQTQLIQQRRRAYNPIRPPIDSSGRVVIVVDDGLATGSTMICALQSIKAKHPHQLVCAIPVSSTNGVASVRSLCDEVVCLHPDPYFRAVGYYYRDFSEVSDEVALEMLK